MELIQIQKECLGELADLIGLKTMEVVAATNNKNKLSRN